MGIFAVLLGSEDALLPSVLGCIVICLLINSQDSERSCRHGRLPTGTWTSSSYTEPEINGQVPSMLESARGPQVCTGRHRGCDAHREKCSWDPVSLPWLHLQARGGRTLNPPHLPQAESLSSEIPSSWAFSQVGWLSHICVPCSRGFWTSM